MIAVNDLVEYQASEGAPPSAGYVLELLGADIALEPARRPGERIMVPRRLVRELSGAAAVEVAEGLRVRIDRGPDLPAILPVCPAACPRAVAVPLLRMVATCALLSAVIHA